MRRISENPTLRECKVGALFVMIRLYFKLQFFGELPRPPRHKTGEGRSPSLRVEAGSAEGGLERLGAHR